MRYLREKDVREKHRQCPCEKVLRPPNHAKHERLEDGCSVESAGKSDEAKLLVVPIRHESLFDELVVSLAHRQLIGD